MTRVSWSDQPRIAESGVDRGVIYPLGANGEAWNGLISVEEDSDSDNRVQYLDGVKYQNRRSPASFSGTISAYTYPDSFDQDSRKPFGMSYRVKIGDKYKIHLVYNVLAAPSSRSRQYNEADPFSWAFTTSPVPVGGHRLTAHLIVDTSIAYPETVAAFEDLIYGDDAFGYPTLPLPDEINQIFEDHARLQVVDLGDGLWRINAPDEALVNLGSNRWRVSWPSVVQIADDTYQISSY